MFDRGLGHWYRELFFPPQVTGSSACHSADGAKLWGVSPVDVPDHPLPQWFSGRKLRAGHRWERTDPS